jgi:N-acyl-D-amino-acid deacylase
MVRATCVCSDRLPAAKAIPKATSISSSISIKDEVSWIWDAYNDVSRSYGIRKWMSFQPADCENRRGSASCETPFHYEGHSLRRNVVKQIRPTIALILAATAISGQPAKTISYDTVLRHGTILDGSGLRPYKADIGILNGYIAEIGDLSRSQGALDLDVTGLFVAPGFINIHSHAAPAALPTAVNMLTQGVTTEILNPDGGGGVDIAQQLSRSASAGLAVNIGAYIGFNSVWASVVGQGNRRPTAEEVTQMRAIVERGLRQGAWGVSAGLDYKPGYFAQADEVVRVVSVAAPWRTSFPNHERLTPESNFSSRTGIAETIEIGIGAGLVPVITHMKVQGHEQGSAAEVIAMMKEADGAGHYAAADAYPYLAGQTGLGALTVPAWAQDGGRPEMLERFKDPEQRARIAKEIEEALNARFNGAEGVYLPQTKQQLVDIMRERRASAGETIIQILEKGNASAILRFGREDDLIKILQHPSTAIACDCGATLETGIHPRFYGAFPRVLGHYVRETHALAWEDAVRKMSGLPASTAGIVDRGFLVPGMIADITVFDPDTVIDHATYENPTLPSEGIRYVLVNGQLTLRDGKLTGKQAGRVILRSANMPTRPMSVNVTRGVSLAGDATAANAKVRIALNVRQEAGAARAAGPFRLSDPRTGMTIEAARIGLLQTTDKWASFTGRARVLPGGLERSITVIVDSADPLAPAHTASIRVDVEDAYRLVASIDASRAKVLRK